MRRLNLAMAMLLLGATTLAAPADKPVVTEADVVATQLPSYPLDTCVVSGMPLNGMGSPKNVVREGRLVRLCCESCVAEVDKDPAAAIAKIDAAVIAAQRPTYPLEVCPVSGQKLGAMGDPIDYVHGTRLVRMCCKGCVAPFEGDPAPFMKKIDLALMEAQRENYPSDTCLISGQSLDAMGGPFDLLHGTRLVRLCCEGCVEPFRKDPDAALARLGKRQGEKKTPKSKG